MSSVGGRAPPSKPNPPLPLLGREHEMRVAERGGKWSLLHVQKCLPLMHMLLGILAIKMINNGVDEE